MRLRDGLIGLVLLAAPAVALAQSPSVALRSVRVGADDVPKSANFYHAVFGYQEIQRYERPDLLEIIMNTGADVAAAKASTGVKLVVISRPKGAGPSPVSPLVFNTSDVAAVVARATAAGGTIERQPAKSATSGSLIAFVVDPGGNRIEVIQPPAN